MDLTASVYHEDIFTQPLLVFPTLAWCSLLTGSMMAIVFLPWLAALIFSMSSRGKDSLPVLALRILVVVCPSVPGDTAAMILTEPERGGARLGAGATPCSPASPPASRPPRWKLESSHSILRFWCSNVVWRSWPGAGRGQGGGVRMGERAGPGPA